MKSTEMALTAETILFTQRNLKPSLAWLRSIGLDAPGFPDRCFLRRAGGIAYGIAASDDMIDELTRDDADFGLLGTDKFNELPLGNGLQLEPLGKLACRFALFVPQIAEWDESRMLTVATSNPNTLASFAAEAGIYVSGVAVMEGKVERAPASGKTDAGFDIVETGASLVANDLRIVMEGPPVELGGIWKDGSSDVN